MVVPFEQIVRDINAQLPHPHTYEPPRSPLAEHAVTIRVVPPAAGPEFGEARSFASFGE